MIEIAYQKRKEVKMLNEKKLEPIPDTVYKINIWFYPDITSFIGYNISFL